jgi:hypothetical protein
MLRLFYLFTFIIFSQTVMAWEDHAKLTSIVLDQWSKNNKPISVYLEQSVKPETLSAFLEATKTTLPSRLLEIESWAHENEQGYQSIPENILYQPLRADCGSDIESCFRKSLRINLDVPLPPVIFDSLNRYSHSLGFVDVANPRLILPAYIPVTFNIRDFKLIPANAKIRIADIIATASMQPDFGFDTFLYENNGTSFGKIYGFGTQPMGNPAFPFQSQVLFHMSAYHEDARIVALIPRLKENYPEYRSFLYLKLSRFAAETNHPYWSAVFLGWGLHYLQDMTQPYHTSIAYGLDPNVILNALAEMAKNNYVPYSELGTIQANRHVVLENLTKTIVISSADNGLDKRILARALSDRHSDEKVPPYDLDSLYLRNQISNLNPANSPDFPGILQATIPSRYINSPDFHVDELKDFNPLLLQEMTRSQRLQFTQGIAHSLEWFGVYTRACVLAIRPQSSQSH